MIRLIVNNKLGTKSILAQIIISLNNVLPAKMEKFMIQTVFASIVDMGLQVRSALARYYKEMINFLT